MSELVKMCHLTDEEYSKTAWRKKQATLSLRERDSGACANTKTCGTCPISGRSISLAAIPVTPFRTSESVAKTNWKEMMP
ncbi:MAG: hypothetical protein J6Y19_09510 [Kiritimatiellae bacterium]|nr:hypothetical protein [Kiritimatiellia bacterium]